MKFSRRMLITSRPTRLLIFVVCALCFLACQRKRTTCKQRTVKEFDVAWTRNVTVSKENTTQHLTTKKQNRPVDMDLQNKKLQTGDFGNDTQFSEVLVSPTTLKTKGFLTIGIRTIKRKNAMYLQKTISSLLSNMSPTEKEEVLIVIFLADTDPDIKQTLAEEINSTFYDSVSSGLIRIIHAPESYYPHLDISKNLYRQSKIYMMWRVKQCYDYAYLLEYSQGLSSYYMQLEEDVVSSPGYIKSIKQFMGEQNKTKRAPWVCLEFSELGVMSKLYRSSDLKKLSDLLKLFSSEQPADYVYHYFNLMNAQIWPRFPNHTLFQQIKSASLQRSKDMLYGARLNNPKNTLLLKDIVANDERLKNPPADVRSSCVPFMTYYPHLAYNGETGDGFFWTTDVVKIECALTVVFHQPQVIRHVIVESGSELHQDDRIHKGKILVGFRTRKHKGKEICVDTKVIGVFDNMGRVDVDLERKEKEKKVVCLVVVASKQKSWLIVQSIVVTVSSSTI